MSTSFTGALSAQTDSASCKEDTVQYEAVKGDNLTKIARSYGDSRLWEYIYMANASFIANPHLIYPGQKIRIPKRMVAFKKGQITYEDIKRNPFCDEDEIIAEKINPKYLLRVKLDDLIAANRLKVSNKEVTHSDGSINSEKLEQFREAFEKLVKAENAEEKESTENEWDGRMEIDGMVIDETITKIGRDFYNVFYQFWSAPDDAFNYTITINERPAPSLGTIVSVKVNNTYTYQSRLQPRFELIEDAGKEAVRYSFSYLKRNKNGLTIY